MLLPPIRRITHHSFDSTLLLTTGRRLFLISLNHCFYAVAVGVVVVVAVAIADAIAITVAVAAAVAVAVAVTIADATLATVAEPFGCFPGAVISPAMLLPTRRRITHHRRDSPLSSLTRDPSAARLPHVKASSVGRPFLATILMVRHTST